jgi:formate-nitrite transporter family protein
MSERSRERPSRVDDPEKGTRLSAVEVHDNILASASEDAERPSSSLLWSSLAAGLVIGFSFLACAFLSSLAAEESTKKALVAAGYPLGFLFVVIGRMELFTENTLEPVIPLLHERSREKVKSLFRIWLVLAIGNLVGALAFGAVLALTPAVPEQLHDELRNVAASATSGGAANVFYRAIFAGWIMALMSWLLGATTARGAQIVLVFVCAAAIGAFEFRHSIAGAVEAFYRVFDGSASFGEMFFGFVLPALAGNTVGGVILVALLEYAQVKAELPPKPRTAE